MNTGRRFAWVPGAGTVLALLACYGTAAIVGLLSLLGVSLGIHEGAWAAAIGLFALLATIGVAAGYRRHRSIWPLALATLGTGAILWAMFGSYSRVVELAGFAGLVAAAIWDWRAKRRRSDGGEQAH